MESVQQDSILKCDLDCWMIFGHAKYKQEQKEREMFQQMEQEDVWTDYITFVGVPIACTCIIAFEEGRCVHE